MDINNLPIKDLKKYFSAEKCVRLILLCEIKKDDIILESYIKKEYKNTYNNIIECIKKASENGENKLLMEYFLPKYLNIYYSINNVHYLNMPDFYNLIFEYAVKGDNMILYELFKNRISDVKNSLYFAAKNNNKEIVDFILDILKNANEFNYYHVEGIVGAVEGNNQFLFRYLLRKSYEENMEKNPDFNIPFDRLISIAAFKGYYEILEYLLMAKPSGLEKAFIRASDGNNIFIVKKLLHFDNFLPDRRHLFKYLVENNNLEVLGLILSIHSIPSDYKNSLFTIALQKGNLDIIELLFKYIDITKFDLIEYLDNVERIEILKLLSDHGIKKHTDLRRT